MSQTAENDSGDESSFEIPSKKNFKKFLECPICWEVYVPPVYQCAAGHPVCSKCVQKIKRCPQCQRAVTQDLRCYPLESMLHEIVTPCKNKSEGCSVSVACAVMDVHEKVCKFRPIKCTEWKRKVCDNVEVPYSKFLEHLKIQHGCGNLRGILSATKKQFNQPNSNWGMFVIECFGHHFLMKVRMENMSLSVYVVSFDTDRQYNARIYIGHPDDASKRHDIKICSIENFRVLESDPNYFSVKLPTAQLVSLGKEVDENGVDKIKLHISCQIGLNETNKRDRGQAEAEGPKATENDKEPSQQRKKQKRSNSFDPACVARNTRSKQAN